MRKLIDFIRDAVIALIFIGASHAAEPSKEPTDFRGMLWGISVEEASRNIQEQWEKRRAAGEIIIHNTLTDYPTGDRTWQVDYSDTIGGVRTAIVLYFLDKKFVGVLLSFPSEYFDTFDGAFKARYGKPSNEHQKALNNAFGGTYIDERRLWQFKQTRIGLLKYANARTGGGTIERREWIQYQESKTKEKKSRAEKDL